MTSYIDLHPFHDVSVSPAADIAAANIQAAIAKENPWLKAASMSDNILGKLAKAQESDLEAKAGAILSQLGSKAVDKVDPRLLGSKSVQTILKNQREHELADSGNQLNWAKFKEAKRVTGLAEQASLGIGDLERRLRKFGPDGVAIYLDAAETLDKLKTNPYFAERVGDWLNNRQVDISAVGESDDTVTDPRQIQASINALRAQALARKAEAENEKNQALQANRALSVDNKGDITKKTSREIVEEYLKQFNYTGQDAEDFREIVSQFSNSLVGGLKNRGINIGDTELAHALLTFGKAGDWSWVPFLGRFSNYNFDLDAAMDYFSGAKDPKTGRYTGESAATKALAQLESATRAIQTYDQASKVYDQLVTYNNQIEAIKQTPYGNTPEGQAQIKRMQNKIQQLKQQNIIKSASASNSVK